MTNSIRVIGVIATMLVIAACAATSPNVNPPAAVASQNPACLKQTGSRILADDAGCKGVGNSYSSDDIDRTGAATVSQALRTLDLAVSLNTSGDRRHR